MAKKYIKAQDKEREDVIRKGKNLLLEKKNIRKEN